MASLPLLALHCLRRHNSLSHFPQYTLSAPFTSRLFLTLKVFLHFQSWSSVGLCFKLLVWLLLCGIEKPLVRFDTPALEPNDDHLLCTASLRSDHSSQLTFLGTSLAGPQDLHPTKVKLNYSIHNSVPQKFNLTAFYKPKLSDRSNV